MTKFEDKYREEIARMQKSLRKKNKSIKDLNESVKNIKSERDEWKADANQLDKEKDEFIIENEKLKSKLQQQALPVVPECVAKTVELLKNYPNSSWTSLYESLGEEGVIWLNEYQQNDEKFGFGGLNNKLFVLFHLAINGYTVEKPQLFYIELPNVYGLSDSVFVSKVENGTILEFTKGKDYASKFTEQEIKSIDERYWQFAVPAEDGE